MMQMEILALSSRLLMSANAMNQPRFYNRLKSMIIITVWVFLCTHTRGRGKTKVAASGFWEWSNCRLPRRMYN